MQALLLCVALCGSDVHLYNENQYFVRVGRIENSKGEIVAKLANHEIYDADIRHDSADDDGKRLRLYSNLGYTFQGIPLYSNRLYNECVEIFREIETEIPKAQKCLKAHRQNVKELSGLVFSFPDKPVIKGKSNNTVFVIAMGYRQSCNKNEAPIPIGPQEVIGFTDKEHGIMYVTLSPDDDQSIALHEYIHKCGYDHCNVEEENRIFQCAKRAKDCKT